MSDTDTIEYMISRAALGDRKAFADLYDATSAKLLGVCLRVLKDKASAEDALQETFMKIWRYADRYSSNGMSPMTWLITIARNTSIDKLRSRKDTDDLSDVEGKMAASGPTPEQSAIAGSEVNRIMGCMGQLEDDKRAAVRGAYLEGLSYADLAAKFDVPLNTMRTWLRRSLASLRECLAQ